MVIAAAMAEEILVEVAAAVVDEGVTNYSDRIGSFRMLMACVLVLILLSSKDEMFLKFCFTRSCPLFRPPPVVPMKSRYSTVQKAIPTRVNTLYRERVCQKARRSHTAAKDHFSHSQPLSF